MNYKLVFWILFVLFSTTYAHAQDLSEKQVVQENDLGNVTDKFQELFFTAIKLRAIEKHEKAIETLTQCVSINENEAVIYVEMAKNQEALNRLSSAETNYVKAIELLKAQPKIDVQLLLFQNYKDQKKYDQAAEVLHRLRSKGIDLDVEYMEVLLLAKKYKLAIKQIEDFEQKKGFSKLTDNFRDAVYKSTSNYKEAIVYYKKRIAEHPLSEDAYFRLISFYKLEESFSEILKIAQKLEEVNPLQDELPFIFSMVYLELNQPIEAFAYSKKVFANNAIGEEAKTQLVQSLKVFVDQNPNYQDEFIRVLNIAIDEGENAASNEEKANFYLQRDPEKALEFYQKALNDQPNSFDLQQKVIFLQLKQNQLQEALQSSKNALEVFPSQAVFYYLKGRVLFELTQYEAAISVLQEGLDYVFEVSQLQVDSLNLISQAYAKIQQADKAESYKNQAKKTKIELDEMQ